jgi:hypothetical protein
MIEDVMKYLSKLFLLILVIPCFIRAEAIADKGSPAENQIGAIPKAGYPLKGFHSFAVFPRYYSPNQNVVEKTNQILIKELKKFGVVKNIKMHETIPYEVFEGFASGTFLSLDVQDLDSIEDKKIPITQCSLTLMTYVNIEKTKEHCPARIWNKECFLEGFSMNLFEEKITRCVQFLLKEFMEEYSFFNPKQKPVFYLYSS